MGTRREGNAKNDHICHRLLGGVLGVKYGMFIMIFDPPSFGLPPVYIKLLLSNLNNYCHFFQGEQNRLKSLLGNGFSLYSTKNFFSWLLK